MMVEHQRAIADQTPMAAEPAGQPPIPQPACLLRRILVHRGVFRIGRGSGGIIRGGKVHFHKLGRAELRGAFDRLLHVGKGDPSALFDEIVAIPLALFLEVRKAGCRVGLLNEAFHAEVRRKLRPALLSRFGGHFLGRSAARSAIDTADAPRPTKR